MDYEKSIAYNDNLVVTQLVGISLLAVFAIYTEADIVAYRILKQTDILKNHRDVAHQAFRCYFIHRNTVEKEVSLLWIVETGTKLHHRAFPTVPSSSVRHELT